MKWCETQLAWSFAFEAQTILISKHPFFSSLFLLKGLGFWLGSLVFEYIEIWDLEKIQNVCVLVFLCGWMFAGKAFILVKVVQNCKWAIWLWNWVIVLVKKKMWNKPVGWLLSFETDSLQENHMSYLISYLKHLILYFKYLKKYISSGFSLPSSKLECRRKIFYMVAFLSQATKWSNVR